jgi:hypothetical protein
VGAMWKTGKFACVLALLPLGGAALFTQYC